MKKSTGEHCKVCWHPYVLLAAAAVVGAKHGSYLRTVEPLQYSVFVEVLLKASVSAMEGQCVESL